LPQTAHGKLDTHALLLLTPVADTEMAASDAPRPGLEATIARVLSELLAGRQLARESNFFDAGAHSLLLAQAATRLSGELGYEVQALLLFEYPTVAALSQNLSHPAPRGALSESAQRGRRVRERLARLSVRDTALAEQKSSPTNGAVQRVWT